MLNSLFASPLNNKEVIIELSFNSMGLLVELLVLNTTPSLFGILLVHARR